MKESSAQREAHLSHKSATQVYKVCVVIPSPWLETVKEALFAAGAGRYGAYDCCCWQTPGTGQFRPLPGSQPCSGQPGAIHSEETWKVEMLCQERFLKPAIEALLRAHPYEMPAFDFYPVSLAVAEA
ncbi:hypothetical protein [Endozoicomonas acroporae]|uniref:hypothetical protein n=1 Tax=Endozoicomonas acroporae TaxID=1701104 RepID=UPI003D79AF93